MKILAVDDELFALKLLVHQLASLGFTDVSTHERAHDALAELECDIDAICLLFCDLQMPQMDGVEFVRHLACMGYTGSLVLVSGEDGRILQTAEKLAKAHQLHILCALHKPVSPAQLQQVLERHASRAVVVPRVHNKIYGPDEFRHAIVDGELVNYYQPKVRVATGAVVGVEALVRWKHTQDGVVYPDQFIAMAEEHNLISMLTRAVLTAALRQARVWQDAGLALHVAVNVSMDDLSVLDFPDFVASEVDKSGIPLTSLVLEVTEGQLMKDPLASLDILTRLRLKHIGLSIDDFGTGHSTLSQLCDIPFNELKVDKSFVHGACQNAYLRAILMASISMSKQLGMRTVAEGVEDLDDWNLLRLTGCDLAQGYFIARPMPAEEIAGWIRDWGIRRRELAER